MTQKQWYIAGAVVLVIVLVIIAYFALRKHGDTSTASGSSMLGSYSNYCTNPNGFPFYCPTGQVCIDQNRCVTPHQYPSGTACAGSYDCASNDCKSGKCT
jgi:hypothetical protein